MPTGTKAQNVWPEAYPELRTALYAYYHAVEPFGRGLLRILALALELDESAFEDSFTFPIFGIRALHYPPQPPEDENLGLGAHTDASCAQISLVARLGTAADVAPSLYACLPGAR